MNASAKDAIKTQTVALDSLSNSKSYKTLIVFAFCQILHWFATVTTVPLNLRISNVEFSRGKIYLALYDRAEGFLQPGKARALYVWPVSATGTFGNVAGDLPPGTYAVSCFHDLNNNGKLDTNLFGVPTEPYGFSNNARPKFRAPTWSEAQFTFNGQAVSIRLERW